MGYKTVFPENVSLWLSEEQLGLGEDLITILTLLRFDPPEPSPDEPALEIKLNTLEEAEVLKVILHRLNIPAPYEITQVFEEDVKTVDEIPDISQLGARYEDLEREMTAIINEEGLKISLINVLRTLIRVGMMLSAHPDPRADDYRDKKYKYLPFYEIELIRRFDTVEQLKEEGGRLRGFGKDTFYLVKKALKRIYPDPTS